MDKPKIQIIIGSTRSGRIGDTVGKWIFEEAKKRDDFLVELIDLKDLQLPFFDEAVSPSNNQGVYSFSVAQVWAERVGEADGYIFVTPEYNYSFPAVLKNALDYVYREWNNKPAGVVSYSTGPWGGIRAAQQLWQVFVALQMTPIRSGVQISFVHQKFNEQGVLQDEHVAKLVPTFFDQLIWWTKALKAAR